MNQVLVLVGLPGSGKSTFSKKLVECYRNWARINQDEMKTRKACLVHARSHLRKGRSIVIDRCNFDVSQRETWVHLAEEFDVPVSCIVFTTSVNECGERIMVRRDHPTGVQDVHGIGILNRFANTYQPPSNDLDEGFQQILYLEPSPEPECTKERVKNILQLLISEDSTTDTMETPSRPNEIE